MFFSDYVSTLKKHFKKSISNAELCGILFDAIIIPLDLKNQNGRDFIIDKADISRIMNGKKKIPNALQDHIYDKIVLAGLEEYFEQNIIKELVSETSDLYHQLMQLIEKNENISPAHKATLRLLANHKSASLFLAETFILAIRQDGTSTKSADNTATNEPILKICGITTSNELSETVEAIRFRPHSEYTLSEYKLCIRKLYEEITNLQIDDEYDLITKNFYSQMGVLYACSMPVTISESDRLSIKVFAEEIRFNLSEDFFNLGNLRQDVRWQTLNAGKFYGSEHWKLKFDKITLLLKYIECYRELQPIDRAFEKVFGIRIAVKNAGKTFDEDVNVRLMIDKDSLVTSDYFDGSILREIIDRFNDTFKIQRSKNFFEYDDPVTYISQLYRIPSFDNERNFVEEWNELFPYFVSFDNSHIMLEVGFSQILQNTAIAFPAVILLRKYVPEIKYEIRSKFMSEILSGIIDVKNVS